MYIWVEVRGGGDRSSEGWFRGFHAEASLSGLIEDEPVAYDQSVLDAIH